MAWQDPKTDWTAQDIMTPSELNRIEGNIAELKKAATIDIADTAGNFAATNVEDALQELAGNVKNGKTSIANAIVAMGQSASGGDTFDTLAAKIRDISKDATAAEGNVLSGKTFYAGGAKKTGTMPNRGAVVITPSTQNQVIPQGYHNGQGYVKGDANLRAENIGKGRTIFGINGTFEGYYTAGNDVLIETQSIFAGSDTYTKVSEIRVLFSGSIRYYFYAIKSGWIGDSVYRAQIRINGVPVGTERQWDRDMGFTEDINVNQGDLVQLYMRISQPSSQNKSYVNANPIRIMVDKVKKVDILL